MPGMTGYELLKKIKVVNISNPSESLTELSGVKYMFHVVVDYGNSFLLHRDGRF